MNEADDQRGNGQVWQPPVSQQAQGQPGWDFPQPPRRRRRWILWTLLAGVLVVGGCAGVVGVAAFRAGTGADHAVNDFLHAAEQGDSQKALTYACPSATAEDVPEARSHKVRGVQVTHGNGRTTAVVSVDLVLTNGETHHDAAFVEKAGDSWLVCGLQRAG